MPRSPSPATLFEEVGDLAAVSHQASSRSELLGAFAASVASNLSADLTPVLECVSEEAAFILRAGRGFSADLYDRERVPGGLLSQAGRAMLDPREQPVELEDFSIPHDWADDELLSGHGARSGIAVKVKTGTRDFGVLGAFYRDRRTFSPEERRFLLRVAMLLGAGIERLENEKEAVVWRSRTELLRSGAALLKVPAEQDALLSAAALVAVGSDTDSARPMADWCFADALESDGRRCSLRRVEVAHVNGAAKALKEVFWAPLTPNAPHGAPRVYRTRSSELVARVDENFSSAVLGPAELRRTPKEMRPYSYLCVPVVGAGSFHGALGFLRTQKGTPDAYDQADRVACEEFAGLLGAAIDWGLPRPDIAEAQDAVRSHIASTNPGLTAREHQVLERLAGGLGLKQIAADVNISYQTVRTHKRHLCQKLGVDSRAPQTRLVAEATKRGWIDP